MRALPLVALLLLSLALAAGLLTQSRKPPTSVAGGEEMLPAFSIPLLGKPASEFSPRLWNNKVVLLNIFASWCESCVAEHGLLMELSKNGVDVVGIAWKDSPEKAAEWLEKYGNPYRVVGVDKEGKTSIPLGLSGIPESFVIAPDGHIAWSLKAPLTEDIVKTEILPLMEKLKNAP